MTFRVPDFLRKGIALTGLAIGLSVAAAAKAEDKVTAFDVAEDHTRFVFDEAPVHDDGMPAHGNAFITQGYIYPAGTLDDGPGVTKDGEPTLSRPGARHVDLHRLVHRRGRSQEEGAWLVSRQVYHFVESDALIVSQGPEYNIVGEAKSRPITGATGVYAGDALIEQTFLGFHEHGGVKIRFEIPSM